MTSPRDLPPTTIAALKTHAAGQSPVAGTHCQRTTVTSHNYACDVIIDKREHNCSVSNREVENKSANSVI